MFRKIFVTSAISLMALMSTVADAVVIDTTGLTDAQVAALRAHAAQVVADTAAKANKDIAAKVAEDPGAVVSLASTWGQQAASAAEGFAKALGIAAKELNITINDFLKSDAGKLTAILIIWKVAGATILKLVYGILFLAVGLTMVRIMYTRLFTKSFEKVEYSYFGGFFKGTKLVRVPQGIQDFRTEGQWMVLWMIIISVMLILAIGAIFF